MDLIFLGTSCMSPTKDRSHPAMLLTYAGQGMLFDCGEGTQRQLRIAGIKPHTVKKVFITHWHGDHVLGLPGLMQTLSTSDYNETLEIYGPQGTRKSIELMLKTFLS